MSNPEDFDFADRGDEGEAFFVAHGEESGGESVRKAAVLGDDGYRGKMLGGHKGVFVDYMMILHAADGEESFIDSRGDARGVCKVKIFYISRVGISGVLDAGKPAASVGFGADNADISADVENV